MNLISKLNNTAPVLVTLIVQQLPRVTQKALHASCRTGREAVQNSVHSLTLHWSHPRLHPSSTDPPHRLISPRHRLTSPPNPPNLALAFPNLQCLSLVGSAAHGKTLMTGGLPPGCTPLLMSRLHSLSLDIDYHARDPLPLGSCQALRKLVGSCTKLKLLVLRTTWCELRFQPPSSSHLQHLETIFAHEPATVASLVSNSTAARYLTSITASSICGMALLPPASLAAARQLRSVRFNHCDGYAGLAATQLMGVTQLTSLHIETSSVPDCGQDALISTALECKGLRLLSIPYLPLRGVPALLPRLQSLSSLCIRLHAGASLAADLQLLSSMASLSELELIFWANEGVVSGRAGRPVAAAAAAIATIGSPAIVGSSSAAAAAAEAAATAGEATTAIGPSAAIGATGGGSSLQSTTESLVEFAALEVLKLWCECACFSGPCVSKVLAAVRAPLLSQLCVKRAGVCVEVMRGFGERHPRLWLREGGDEDTLLWVMSAAGRGGADLEGFSCSSHCASECSCIRQQQQMWCNLL